MKRQILFIVITAIVSTASFAQSGNDTIMQLQNRIAALEKMNSRLFSEARVASSRIKNLEGSLLSASENIDILKKDLNASNNSITAMAEKFESQFQNLSDRTDSEIRTLQNRVNDITIYWIITLALLVILTSFILLSMRNRLNGLRTALSDQIRITSKVTREEILKLDNQMFWLLDLHKRGDKTDPEESENTDHSLALEVVDEIIRIQKNTSTMDPESKGVKQLEFAVERIQDNFREMGYVMVELLHKPYDEGMHLLAKFKDDDSLKPGEKIITRIIKPRINYKNITIQNGEVEVSVGKTGV